MDLKQLENIRMIAEMGSISKAAKALYITQSALNQQLIHLEEELGVQLFNRGRNHFQITDAGRIYLDGVDRILAVKRDVYNQIGDLRQTRSGTIRLGLMSDRGMSIFSCIYPDFYARYPAVRITPIETSVVNQEQMVETGQLDMAILTLPADQETRNEYDLIYREELMLVVPSEHPLARNGAMFSETTRLPDALPEISLSLFREAPFIIIQDTSTMRPIIDACFRKAGFAPTLVLETRSSYSIMEMAQVMNCCSILPRAYACPTNRVVYYALPEHPAWDFVASHPKKTYLNEPCRYLIQLLKEYWEESIYLYDHLPGRYAR